jgi:hypothetical protein
LSALGRAGLFGFLAAQSLVEILMQVEPSLNKWMQVIISLVIWLSILNEPGFDGSVFGCLYLMSQDLMDLCLVHLLLLGVYTEIWACLLIKQLKILKKNLLSIFKQLAGICCLYLNGLKIYTIYQLNGQIWPCLLIICQAVKF